MFSKKKLGIMLTSIFIVSMFGATFSLGLTTDNPEQSALMARPPTYVTITSPSDGATVTGVVSITISSNRNPYLYIDGIFIGKGLAFSWDTTTYSDGAHTILADYRGTSDQITVTVDNGGTPVDEIPIVTITNPANGATLSDIVAISISVTDEESLIPDLYIDGSFVATTTSYNWDTTSYTDGSSHTIYAEATDSASQTGTDQISVTVDNTVTPPPTGNYPWWNDVIDAEVAHANGITGEGSVVVIIDTGLGANYVDLFPAGSILTQYCTSQTKSLGVDNVDWYQDTEGHGTACSGTVIGYDLNGDYIQGVAPDAKIVMIRTIYWIGGGITETQMLNAWADAIYYALDLHNGALSSYNMVISMSLGYTNTNSYFGAAVAAAENDGVILSTSAGNDGHVSTTTGYPATYADVTSVAAAGWSSLTGSYGIDGILTDIPEGDFSELIIADFSSGGKVDITGIGYNLVLPQHDGYYYMSGTSFSCPQLAGVYALMFEAHGAQTVQWHESMVQNTAYWGSGMTTFVWGAGFVQADAACGF